MFSIPCFLRPIHSRKNFQSISVTSTVKLSLLPSINPATTSLMWLSPSARIARLPTKSVNFIYERTVLNKYLMISAPRWLDFYCIDTYGAETKAPEDLNSVWYFFRAFCFRTKFVSLFCNCRFEEKFHSKALLRVIGASRLLYECAYRASQSSSLSQQSLGNCKPTIIFWAENGKQIRKADPGGVFSLSRCLGFWINGI